MKINIVVLFTLCQAYLCFGFSDTIHSIPDNFPQSVVRSLKDLKIIEENDWNKIIKISKIVVESKGGLSGIAPKSYLGLKRQREIIRNLKKSNIQNEYKLILIDVLVQYYFYTYYYDHHSDFDSSSLSFLNNIEADFRYCEPAGQNYYLHTFLKQLMTEYPDSKAAEIYRGIYNNNHFDDFPKGD
jgi:hypothetical protein